ncbi:hypothetical protein [Sphingomonas sp. 28-63-12]|uniref:hypothetical protein n=1 Tax=Sphingomonas sp. 28-63-12 TaxID=1970434 RepID=UPI000BCE475E|nr:MAG: hypothetical protein B7Y47_13890 [Sphingomonas sp. 28-63-12]
MSGMLWTAGQIAGLLSAHGGWQDAVVALAPPTVRRLGLMMGEVGPSTQDLLVPDQFRRSLPPDLFPGWRWGDAAIPIYAAPQSLDVRLAWQPLTALAGGQCEENRWLRLRTLDNLAGNRRNCHILAVGGSDLLAGADGILQHHRPDVVVDLVGGSGIGPAASVPDGYAALPPPAAGNGGPGRFCVLRHQARPIIVVGEAMTEAPLSMAGSDVVVHALGNDLANGWAAPLRSRLAWTGHAPGLAFALDRPWQARSLRMKLNVNAPDGLRLMWSGLVLECGLTASANDFGSNEGQFTLSAKLPPTNSDEIAQVLLAPIRMSTTQRAPQLEIVTLELC